MGQLTKKLSQYGNEIISHNSRDSTAIESREKSESTENYAGLGSNLSALELKNC